jgi:hypothetical protein
VSEGTVSGTVTNSLTGAPLSDVAVTVSPAIPGVNVSTGEDGTFSIDLPIGVYTLTFAKANFTSQTVSVSVIADEAATVSRALVPTAPVILATSLQGTAEAGNTLTASVTVTPLDGSTVRSIAWSQSNGVEVVIGDPDAATTTVELPGADVFKDELFDFLGEAALDRFGVQGLNPFQLEETGQITLTVTVTTSSGTYISNVTIHTALPWAVNPGLLNVPVGLPILLHGKDLGDEAVYDWSLSPPSGSSATLTDATSQNPYFTPDRAGRYTVTVTDTTKTPSQVVTLNIDAGNWVGSITGQDENGRPLAAGCTNCHNGTIAPANFAEWAQSGHAEIFTQNFNTNPSYNTSCLTCHTVGWDLSVDNGGIEDVPGYQDFLDAFTTNGRTFIADRDNWTNLLSEFPDVAKLANIQCENCHGPNSTPLHFNQSLDEARISISSDVCGTCHGEPARHGRFQQWQESPHANYELALTEATVEGRGATAGHCGRCHSGQGFIAWIQQDDLTQRIQGANGNATVAELAALGLTRDKVHPQTCTACHDPHAQGTTSGEPNTATVRIMDSTPLLPAGFAALAVGRGAVCITCHNTRNGTRNDEAGLPTNYAAPHTAAQGDVLMGQNAYFVPIGSRSPHSYIEDTCATCHMEFTPPPPEFSFSGAGTNHSFRASLEICTQCHGAFNGGTLRESTELELEALAEVMSEYLMNRIEAAETIFIRDYTPHDFEGESFDLRSDNTQIEASNIKALHPAEPHGQQGFVVSFVNPVDFTYRPAGRDPHTITLEEAEVQLGDFTTDGTAKLIPASDPLVRAGWNFFLIEGDGSMGIHNPTFTFEAIAEARAVMEEALEVEVPD